MSTISAPTILAGGLFGAALLYSGVFAPSVIQGQLSLSSFYMLQTFLAASGVSTILAHFNSLSSRSPAPVPSYLPPYAFNVVGGILQGIGMAISGSCPGTGLVALSVGVPSGLPFALGGIVGAAVYQVSSPYLQPSSSSTKATASSTTSAIPPTVRLIIWEIVCASAIAGTMNISGGTSYSAAIRGGLAIGAAQIASIYLRGAMVGVSGGYAQVVEYVYGLAKGSRNALSLGTAAQFSIAVAGGAWLLQALAPEIAGHGVSKLGGSLGMISAGSISWQHAALGGLIEIFGARLAGGCTSGHGLSGLATFGLASFVTVGSTFASGIATAMYLGL